MSLYRIKNPYCPQKSENLDSSLDFIGTEAPRTDIHMARRAVDHGLYTPYIGLEHTIGSSVGVGHGDTEFYTLTANLALCHLTCTSYRRQNYILITPHIRLYTQTVEQH